MNAEGGVRNPTGRFEVRNDDPAIQFLLNSSDPSICYLTLVDLLEKSARSREVKAACEGAVGGSAQR
jgi:hypothetical protein